MPYLGVAPNPRENREVDDISSGFNGGTTQFTLQSGGSNVSPGSDTAIIVSLGGVVQNPGTDYTIAASTITFTTAPASGLTFFGVVLAQSVDIETPADGTVTTSKIVDNAVTTAKIANDAVDGDKIATNSVGEGELSSGAVTNDKVSNSAAIAVSKLANFVTNNADNRVITGSGTTNTLNGEADFTFDGNDLTINKTSGDSDVIIKTTTSGNPVLKFNAAGAGGHDISHERSSNSLIFNRTGSSERMRIDSSGNLGINTSSPSDKLHVNGGDVIISTATAPNLRIVKADNSSGGATNRVFLGIASGNNNFLNGSVDNDTCLVYSQGGKLLIGTGTSVEAGLDSSGNLGVGTASPDSRISIIGTGSDPVTRLSITDGTGVADFLGRNGNIILNADRNAAVAGSLMAFKVDNNEYMRIAASGAVGIGTTNPQYKLHVLAGVVDLSARIENAKTGDGDINYIGVALASGSTGVALFGHTGHSTTGSQAAWMGLGGDDVAGGVGVKCFRGGAVQMNGTLRVNTSTQYGKLHVLEGAFNPNNSSWLDEVSYVASGSFGGGYSLLDGSKGYSMYCHGSGNHFAIQHHSSTTATASGGVELLNAATSWTSASDEREKENLVTISDAITKIKTLRTVIGNYTWQPDIKHAFLIAQDVQAVLPEAVDIRNTYEETEKQRLGLRYTEVIPLLTAALKEAVAEIDTLKTKVAALEAA